MYRICGITMVAALLVIVAGRLITSLKPYYVAHNLTFWMEAIAVEAFAVSWLVKGELVFKSM